MESINQGSGPVLDTPAYQSCAPLDSQPLYLRADEIKLGDYLPDVSRWPVVAIGRTVGDDTAPIVFTMGGAGYVRIARHGGSEYGYECFRVSRPI